MEMERRRNRTCRQALRIPKSGFESLLRFLLTVGRKARQCAGPLYNQYYNTTDNRLSSRISTKSRFSCIERCSIFGSDWLRQ